MSDREFKTIASVGRQSLLDQIKELECASGSKLIYGIGDDAAVFEKTAGEAGLLTSETFQEGINFDLTYTPLHHLGYKVISATASDIYAMNGTPDAVLVNLALPNKLSADMVNQIYGGIDAACRDYDIQLAGGDLSASHSLLSISATVYGRAEEERLTYRSGAREEDAICVTGDLGGAIAGLRILMREKKYWEEHQQNQAEVDLQDYEYVVKRQLVPVARRDLIDTLREHDIVPSAMIDISRGLLNDLNQMAAGNRKGLYIYEAAIPIAIETRQVADEMKEDVDQYALYGGEDYELMFTLDKEQVEKLTEVFKDFVVIGKVTAKEGIKMQSAEGDVIDLKDDEE